MTAVRPGDRATFGSNSPGCDHDWQYEGDETIGGKRYRVYKCTRCTRCGWRDRQQA